MIPNGDVIVLLGTERLFSPVSEFSADEDVYVSDLQKLNARCLATFGMRPQQVRLLPKDWRDWPGADATVEDIRAYLKNARDWQKELLTPGGGNEILVPLYAEALKREGVFVPTFLICFHNPLVRLPNADESREVNDERIVGLRVKYLLNALANTRGLFRRVVPYVVYAASTDIGPAERPDFSGWPPMIGDVYDLCCETANDPEGLNEGKFDARIEELCDAMRIVDVMANAVDLPDDNMTFAWQGGNLETQILPVPGWQTFRAKVDAPAGAKIQFDPYQTPCYFWIRRATWITQDGTRDAIIKPGKNGALEEIYGLRRLSVFGPSSAKLESPGPAEFEIECLIQANDVVLKDLILALKARDATARTGWKR